MHFISLDFGVCLVCHPKPLQYSTCNVKNDDTCHQTQKHETWSNFTGKLVHSRVNLCIHATSRLFHATPFFHVSKCSMIFNEIFIKPHPFRCGYDNIFVQSSEISDIRSKVIIFDIRLALIPTCLKRHPQNCGYSTTDLF